MPDSDTVTSTSPAKPLPMAVPTLPTPSISADPDDMQAALASVPRSLLEHVVDVHCHPTDSDMGMTLDVAQEMAIRVCAMATRRSDQRLVAALARAHPAKVIPCFGWCRCFVGTWFSSSRLLT